MTVDRPLPTFLDRLARWWLIRRGMLLDLRRRIPKTCPSNVTISLTEDEVSRDW